MTEEEVLNYKLIAKINLEEQLDLEARSTWYVKRTFIQDKPPGPGWEPFAFGPNYSEIYWKKRYLP